MIIISAFNEKPNDMYGKIMSIPDGLMFKYYSLVSNVNLKEIEDLKIMLDSGKISLRDLKRKLAREVISIYYDENTASRAEQHFINVFVKKVAPDDIEVVKIKETVKLLDFLLDKGLIASKGEKRLIKQSGIKVNDSPIDEINFEIKANESLTIKLVKGSLLELNNIEKIIVNTPVASIYSKPQFKSELITQALFYESLKIIDKRKKWYKVKLLDGYEGWIHSFYTYELFGKFEKNINISKYWVKKKFTNLIFNDGTSLTLSFGSLLPCLEFDNKIIIKLYDGREGELDKNDLSSYENPLKLCEFIDLHINQFLGIQYLWGGKSSFGFDCSGLIQTILNVWC